MYEHKRQPLAPVGTFYKRILKNLLIAVAVMAISLAIGITGYYYSCNDITALDAFHNAAMILSGMGPVITISCKTGKWFSSFYALFSGVIFISNMGIILLPVAHRLFHSLHLEEN